MTITQDNLPLTRSLLNDSHALGGLGAKNGSIWRREQQSNEQILFIDNKHGHATLKEWQFKYNNKTK